MEMFDFEVKIQCPVLLTDSVKTFKAYDEADAIEQAKTNHPYSTVKGVTKKENDNVQR